MPAAVTARKEGWGTVLVMGRGMTKKHHYIKENGRSLCGRYGRRTDAGLEDFEDQHTDNCAACKKLTAAYRAKKGATK